jgi:cellulose synthase/poly-beta-1,6-N-acetylglucosamine synthase-like glycosyltransferase
LKIASGEFVAIFDADFLPPADFLRRTLPYFSDAGLAMVQTRWSYVNRGYSALTEVEAILLDGHFVIEHNARYRRGSFFNFNGTAGVWRRTAIEDAGGWEHDTLTEDTDLSYRAQLRGWHFLYLPEVDCPSELPVEMNAFKAQQARWAKGLMQTAKKILPRVMRARVPGHVKAEAFFHLTANISYPLMIVLSIILLPAMIVRFYQGWFQVLVIDLPLFLASTCSISSFYLASERALYPTTWKRTFLYLPFVMAVGIGLSVRNALAVLEAIFGIKTEFARTPKYRIEGQRGAWAKKSYRKRAGWMPYAEVALGLYFALAVAYALQNENYATIPFLLLFVWGYLYTGLMSIGQAYFERFRFGASMEAAEARPAATGAPGF